LTKKIKIKNIFYTPAKRSLRELKRKQKKAVGEYCWAITQAAGRSSCGRSGSNVLGFGLQLDCLVHKYLVEQVYPKFGLAQN
jgi:hypothetical protein